MAAAVLVDHCGMGPRPGAVDGDRDVELICVPPARVARLQVGHDMPQHAKEPGGHGRHVGQVFGDLGIPRASLGDIGMPPGHLPPLPPLSFRVIAG
jgi:hypothetical protein